MPLESLRISLVDETSAMLLGNLFELYCHDMSEWLEVDLNEDGLYAYPVHSCWENNGAVLIAYADKLPIGFAIVQSSEALTGKAGGKDLKEFFVLRKFRRTGVGKIFANHVWDLFPGNWLVRVASTNRPAVPFWRKVVASYSSGDYQEKYPLVNDREWSHFVFESLSS